MERPLPMSPCIGSGPFGLQATLTVAHVGLAECTVALLPLYARNPGKHLALATYFPHHKNPYQNKKSLV